MHFASFLYKNLTRRPFRTSLTLLALATAIAAVVALLGITKGFVHAFEEVYSSHSIDVVVSRQGSADRLSSSVDQGFIDRIAELPGVQRAAGVLLDTLSLEDQGVYGVPGMGIEPGSWLLEDYQMRSQVKVDSSQTRRLMLGVHLADRVGLSAGEKLNLFDEPYLVSAVFESRSTWENGSMILPLDQLQELTDRSHQVTYINVMLQPESDAGRAERVLGEIESLDPKLLALTTDEFVSTDTRMQVAAAMAWMTSIVALVIGAISTLNTMMTSVLERTAEIGILRAIGWRRRRVAKMVLLESLGLALTASLIGAGLAILGTYLLSRSQTASGLLTPVIDWRVLAQGLGLAAIIGLFGALLPAWRAASLMPTDAFHER
jgi:putative ABC transport system permease protein